MDRNQINFSKRFFPLPEATIQIHNFLRINRSWKLSQLDNQTLVLSGKLPILFKDKKYGIPLTICVEKRFPLCSPVVLIKFDVGKSYINQKCSIVNENGLVIADYIRKWRNSNNLIGLINYLSNFFSKSPPLFSGAKPESSAPKISISPRNNSPINASPQPPNSPHFKVYTDASPQAPNSPHFKVYTDASPQPPNSPHCKVYTAPSLKRMETIMAQRASLKVDSVLRTQSFVLGKLTAEKKVLADGARKIQADSKAMQADLDALAAGVKELERAAEAASALLANIRAGKAEDVAVAGGEKSRLLVDLASRERGLADSARELRGLVERGEVSVAAAKKLFSRLYKSQFMARVAINEVSMFGEE